MYTLKNKAMKGTLLAILFMLSADGVVATTNLEAQTKVLNMIGDHAERICGIPLESTNQGIKLSAEAQAELNKVLAEIKGTVAAEYIKSRSYGALQEDLAGTIQVSVQCKNDVSKRLERLIPTIDIESVNASIPDAWQTVIRAAGQSGDLGRRNALKVLHEAGEALTKLNLIEADLRGIELPNADLSETEFIGGNLSRVDFSGANLGSADLRSTNLSGANLSGANLIWTYLEEANLDGADLSGANLENALLYRAKGLDCKQLTAGVRWELAHRDTKLTCGKNIPPTPQKQP